MAAGSGVHPAGATARLPARHQHLDRVGVGGRDRRLAPLQRQQHRLVRRLVPANTPRAAPAVRDQSPRPATVTSAGSWSKPPGTTDRRTGSVRPCETGGRWRQRPPATAETRQPTPASPLGAVPRPPETPHRRHRRHRPRAGRLVLVTGRPRRPRADDRPLNCLRRTASAAAPGATRDTTMSSQPSRIRRRSVSRHADPLQPKHRPAVTNPRRLSPGTWWMKTSPCDPLLAL